MDFVYYSHRNAEAIIEFDKSLKERYEQFVGAIRSITDEELIEDFYKKKEKHKEKSTAFKSMTPSINELLKKRLESISGWKSEVDIFNDGANVIGNTEWRLDFACENALCVEVAFNHGEAIAWNLLKPVLSCELNHVQKAIQGKIGIYVCATDNMKLAANIDSASGSYEKVLRYLPPMMNQLTIPMMIIGLKPFRTFKVNRQAEIVRSGVVIDSTLLNQSVTITNNDDKTYKGTIIGVDCESPERSIVVQKTKRDSEMFSSRMIKFLEITN